MPLNDMETKPTIETIVVGCDETEPARRALVRAAELATAFGARVIVTSIAQVLVAPEIGPIDPADPPELHEEELKHASALLAERGVEGEYEVALGDPASEIVELAERRNADLIVVGTRDPSLVLRLLWLSMGDSGQRKAHYDILIVH